MEYVIKCGKNYIGYDSCGKYTEVTSITQASKGPMHKMQNFINNCIGPSMRSKCKVVEATAVVKEAAKPVVSHVATTSSVQSVVDNIITELKKIDASVFDAEKDILNKKLSKIDQEITDIQHYIEFNRLNAAEGYKAFKLLQDKLLERRVIKDDFSKFQVLSDSKISDIFNGNLDKSLSALDKRTYTPRVLKELFEEGKHD